MFRFGQNLSLLTSPPRLGQKQNGRQPQQRPWFQRAMMTMAIKTMTTGISRLQPRQPLPLPRHRRRGRRLKVGAGITSQRLLYLLRSLHLCHLLTQAGVLSKTAHSAALFLHSPIKLDAIPAMRIASPRPRNALQFLEQQERNTANTTTGSA